MAAGEIEREDKERAPDCKRNRDVLTAEVRVRVKCIVLKETVASEEISKTGLDSVSWATDLMAADDPVFVRTPKSAVMSTPSVSAS